MEWAEVISNAVKYIEDHITEDITMYEVADHVNISPFYFHKGFSILCGYSIAEYIRNRRMALAGEELITSDITVMELAMKYGFLLKRNKHMRALQYRECKMKQRIPE